MVTAVDGIDNLREPVVGEISTLFSTVAAPTGLDPEKWTPISEGSRIPGKESL
jgi:hypothetical protein